MCLQITYYFISVFFFSPPQSPATPSGASSSSFIFFSSFSIILQFLNLSLNIYLFVGRFQHLHISFLTSGKRRKGEDKIACKPNTAELNRPLVRSDRDRLKASTITKSQPTRI